MGVILTPGAKHQAVKSHFIPGAAHHTSRHLS